MPLRVGFWAPSDIGSPEPPETCLSLASVTTSGDTVTDPDGEGEGVFEAESGAPSTAITSGRLLLGIGVATGSSAVGAVGVGAASANPPS